MKPYRLATADPATREVIYRLRHEIYARELHQHEENPEGRLEDELDSFNQYVAVWHRAELVGFISITPPGHARYSVDKYVPRDRLPFPFDAGLYEVRILTVLPAARHGQAAALLMYGALRWIEAQGGTHITAIGRREVLSVYDKAGMERTGIWVQSGAVSFEVLHATTAALRSRLQRHDLLLRHLERVTEWNLDPTFRPAVPCFHGGAFFEALGERFDHLERRHTLINADVLDAWFPPAPRVLSVLTEHLPWLLRTSPPNHADGLCSVIAEQRNLPRESILHGAGSSDLIFRAFREWFGPGTRALVLDPTYSEYTHVLEQVVGARVDRLRLERNESYDVLPERLAAALKRGYDLVVLVNPNSPTGRHLPGPVLREILVQMPRRTLAWVDETYLEYVGSEHSMEALAAASDNVVICKSMSKVYALSGARVAYLCGPARRIEALRGLTPPWAVSLPAQLAAVTALQESAYYRARWSETHDLREQLSSALRGAGWDVVPGSASFILAHLPENGPTTAEFAAACRTHDLYVRDPKNMSTRFGPRAIRVAVKDAATNRRMLGILKAAAAGK